MGGDGGDGGGEGAEPPCGTAQHLRCGSRGGGKGVYYRSIVGVWCEMRALYRV